MKRSQIKASATDATLFSVSQTGEVYDGFFQFLERATPTQYDRLMDRAYAANPIGGGFHRTFDGTHTLYGSYTKIHQETGDVEFLEFIKSHANELVTPEGIPIFTLDHEAYNKMTHEASDILGNVVSPGQLRSYVRDINSVNAPELLGAGLGALFLWSAIRSNNEQAISRVVAGNLALGLLTGNPLQLFIGLSGLTYGIYNGKIRSWALLQGAAPSVAGVIGYQISSELLHAGAKTSLAVSLVTGIATSVLLAKIDENKRASVTKELGENGKYIPVMTQKLLQQEISIFELKRNSITIAI